MMMQETPRFINEYIKPKSGNHFIMEQVDDDAGKPKIYKWIDQTSYINMYYTNLLAYRLAT
jgi:hypothetical protein